MFKPDDPKLSKYLVIFQGNTEVNASSLNASHVLHDHAPGPVKIRWNARTGVSQSVRGILTEPGEGSAREIADRFLAENRELFGIPQEAADLYFVHTRERRGVCHVTYQQRYEDMPVTGAEITVHIDQANRVQMVNGNYCPGIEVDTTVTPIAETAAIEAVIAAIETKEQPEAQTELVVFPLGSHYIRAYKVSLKTRKPLGDWVYFVNAATGEVVDGYNAVNFAKGSGNLYNTNPRRDDGVVTAELFDLDDSGTLSGTYFEVKNDADNSTNATPTGPGQYDFLYADPADTHFDEVMVYYHLSRVAEFFRNLGHDEHQLRMSAHVHVPDPDTGDPNYDNAYFSPYDNAVYFGHGKSFNDLAKEAGVIYHEYSHSIIHAIQPFMGTEEAGALHEGYADFFGCSLTNDPKIGEFVVDQLGEDYLRDLRSQTTYNDFSGANVHNDGEIWGSTCWKIRETLGRRVADLLLYEGLWFLPQNATFVDAYDGILQADKNLFGGEHLVELEEIFQEKKISPEPAGTYVIVASAGSGGSISPSGTVSVKKGENQKFKIIPETGYSIKHILVDGASVGAVSGYKFENVESSHTIEAFFEKEGVVTHTIQASAGSGGSIAPSGKVDVSHGANQLFTIMPDTGYTVRHTLVDGSSVGSVTEYTFNNVTSSHIIETLFEESGQTERTVIVPGNTEWMDSGMVLEVGDIISITAHGTVFYDNKGNSCGPGGTSWTDTRDQEDPLWQKPHAGLIGKVEGIGAPFFIGESYTVKAGSSGRLLLGINDHWYQGNSGEFIVTIQLVET